MDRQIDRQIDRYSNCNTAIYGNFHIWEANSIKIKANNKITRTILFNLKLLRRFHCKFQKPVKTAIQYPLLVFEHVFVSWNLLQINFKKKTTLLMKKSLQGKPLGFHFLIFSLNPARDLIAFFSDIFSGLFGLKYHAALNPL